MLCCAALRLIVFTGLVDAVEAACRRAPSDLLTARQAASEHTHVPYLYSQLLTVQQQLMHICAAVKPQHERLLSTGSLESFAGCALALLRLSDADFQLGDVAATAAGDAAAVAADAVVPATAAAASAAADAAQWPQGYKQRQQHGLSCEVQPAVLKRTANLLLTCCKVSRHGTGNKLQSLDVMAVPSFIKLALLLMAAYIAILHRQHAACACVLTDPTASSSGSGGSGGSCSRSGNSHSVTAVGKVGAGCRRRSSRVILRHRHKVLHNSSSESPGRCSRCLITTLPCCSRCLTKTPCCAAAGGAWTILTASIFTKWTCM